MTRILKFDEDIVENGFHCTECGCQLWNTISNEPGESLAHSADQPDDTLYCIGCGSPVGIMKGPIPGKITYKVNIAVPAAI